MDKREQILDATARVLAREGLAGATTRAITTEAGCAEGTLYLYFKGRAELFLALFERHLSTAFPDSAELLGEKKKDVAPEAVLLDVALAFLRFHREVGPLLAALFAEPALLKRYRALIVSRNPDLPRASPAVVAYLREQQRRKRVAAHVDAGVVAEALLGACFARAFHDNMFDHVSPAPADRKFLRALIRGLLNLR